MSEFTTRLSDFARECGVTDRAIQKHLKAMREQLEGHYERRGPNGTWLDEYAMEEIRKHMIRPAPPVVSDGSLIEENEKLRQMVMDMQSRMLGVQQQMLEQSQRLAEATAERKLLEASQEKVEDLTHQLEKEREAAAKLVGEAEAAKNQVAAVTKDVEIAKKRVDDLERDLELEKTRKLTFKERLTGRKS